MIDVETYAAAKAYTDSHGEGGTTNYNALDNKPHINSVELSGNKTAEDLGLVASVEGKGLSTNDYTDEAKAIVDGVTGALAEKADTDDIPDLVSDNLARGILGNETVLSTDNTPFVSKTMGAGKYQRKKFVGCSFVWNQMIENGDFSDGTTGWSIYNAVYGYITASNNVITLTAQRAMPYSDVAFRKYNLNRKANHRYYISFSYKTTSSNGISFSGTMLSQGTGFEPTTEWTKITILTSRDTDDDNAYITFGFGNPAVGDTLDVKEVYMVDLTQLFGSTTIADYIYNLEQATAGAGVAKLKELGFFTEDYYAYDAGSVQSVDIKEYKVTKDNIVTTYPLTPTELRGVPRIDANNNIYCDGDEYASDGGVTRKYGIVDLGTLNWGYDTYPRGSYFYARVPLRKPGTNFICIKYPNIGVRPSSYAVLDKIIAVEDLINTYIDIVDSSYTDADSFKTAMSGVYLVYEKATPTTETLTPFDYPQSVGSLEEITDYKVEQEDRDVAIPTGHVTEYMGKGGEFTLPTLPQTPSVLAFDGHNFFWKPETA